MTDVALSADDTEPEAESAWSIEEAAAQLAYADAARGSAPEDADDEDLEDELDEELGDELGEDFETLNDAVAGPHDLQNGATRPLGSTSETDRHSIKLDGQDQGVSLGELKAGYQRQADYTRKTQSLADERRQLQTERSQYQHVLGTLSQNIAAGPANPPDQTLLDSDPAEYVRQSQQWHARQQVAGAAAREQARLQSEIDQEQTTNQAQQQAQQDHFLAATVPGWSDPVARQTGKQAVGDYLVRAYGATPEDLSEFTDHRLVVLAQKAMEYDKLMSKRDLAQKKVRSVPQVQAPGAARSKQEVDAATVKAMRDQFHKSGSIDDAAKLMRYLGG